MKPKLLLVAMIIIVASIGTSNRVWGKERRTFAPNAITVDAAFDSGSIGAYTVVGNVVNLTLRIDNIVNNNNYEYWANFKLSGVLNQAVTLNITDIADVTFLAEQTKENQMVYSCDGATWNRLTVHSYLPVNNGTYTIVQTFPCDQPQIAMFFPFPYQKMQDYVNTVAQSSWATKTVLGQSTQGRDLDLLTITNPAYPDSGKDVIYIIGRLHAAETASSHMLQGMIDFLTSNHVDARRMRDNFIWYIVPMVNPDGVYLGNTRATSEGRDANRDWDNNNTPEVNTVRSHIETIDGGSNDIDLFIDWHNHITYTDWYNFVFAPSGNDFFSVLSKWTDFDSQRTGSTSCSSGSCSSRGYGMLRQNLFTFVFEPTPHLVTWTVDSLQQQGVYTAYAIDEYFGPFASGDLIYLSTRTNGSVDGVAFESEDVISYDPNASTWALVWDGSDVNVLADLDAFSLMDDGTLLMSFNVDTVIPDVGLVDDSDLVRFTPTILGPQTSGAFELYFDGSDVGLTEYGEDVDAVGFAPDGRLLVSTLGSFDVGSVTGEDEDLIAFDHTSLGENTAGSWSLYFDGSDVSLADKTFEDMWGAWVDSDTDEIALTTRAEFAVPGVSGSGADVFSCAPSSVGETTACTFGPGLYLDGAAVGLSGETLDALHIDR